MFGGRALRSTALISWCVLLCSAIPFAGCLSDGEFRCDSDARCTRSREAGRCIEGYCAFQDPSCGGALRWDESAGQVAGQCTTALDAGAAEMSASSMDMAKPVPFDIAGPPPIDIAIPADQSLLRDLQSRTDLDSSVDMVAVASDLAVVDQSSSPDADCPGRGICNSSFTVGGHQYKACSEPITGCSIVPMSGCSNGTSCFSVAADGSTGCRVSGTVGVGGSCTTGGNYDCAPGEACVGSGGPFQCRSICRLAGPSTDCPSGKTCQAITAWKTGYGVCL